MGRNLSIDLVKIVAMFSVMALHISQATEVRPCFVTKVWYSVFGIAIPLFFMTSGYLLINKDMTGGQPQYRFLKIYGILRYVFITTTPWVLYGLISCDISFLHNYYLCFLQSGQMPMYWYFGSMILIYLLSPQLFEVMNSRYAFKFVGGGNIDLSSLFSFNLKNS